MRSPGHAQVGAASVACLPARRLSPPCAGGRSAGGRARQEACCEGRQSGQVRESSQASVHAAYALAAKREGHCSKRKSHLPRESSCWVWWRPQACSASRGVQCVRRGWQGTRWTATDIALKQLAAGECAAAPGLAGHPYCCCYCLVANSASEQPCRIAKLSIPPQDFLLLLLQAVLGV